MKLGPRRHFQSSLRSLSPRLGTVFVSSKPKVDDKNAPGEIDLGLSKTIFETVDDKNAV